MSLVNHIINNGIIGVPKWTPNKDGLITPSGQVVIFGDALPAPVAQNRKIVFFGSSVSFGSGATSDHGWAYRLTQRLTSYTCVNKSIGGNTTVSLINRFYTDVVPENPSIVVIGLSLANEGLQGADKDGVYNQYINNMHTLVAMCRKMGYAVIVTGAYPNDGYTALEYQYIKQANKVLENSDFPYINFLGAVDDGIGHWRSGMASDAGHPNDIGHEALSRTFPQSIFDRLPASSSAKINVSGTRGFTMGVDTTTPDRIMYAPSTPFGSFTFMASVRRPVGTGMGRSVLAAVFNGFPLRIRNSGTFRFTSRLTSKVIYRFIIFRNRNFLYQKLSLST